MLSRTFPAFSQTQRPPPPRWPAPCNPCPTSQAYRSLLPATGSPYEGPEGGNVEDAADFLLLNFTEMNKLWVRLQHQGGTADQGRRETERRELADLVGKNLTYLSQLEGLTFAAYRDLVLPRWVQSERGRPASPPSKSWRGGEGPRGAGA